MPRTDRWMGINVPHMLIALLMIYGENGGIQQPLKQVKGVSVFVPSSPTLDGLSCCYNEVWTF